MYFINDLHTISGLTKERSLRCWVKVTEPQSNDVPQPLNPGTPGLTGGCKVLSDIIAMKNENNNLSMSNSNSNINNGSSYCNGENGSSKRYVRIDEGLTYFLNFSYRNWLITFFSNFENLHREKFLKFKFSPIERSYF